MVERTINFYRPEHEYGIFSNFYPSPIVLNGKEWPTSEHYFQAMKFVGNPMEESIRLAETPGKAKRLGGTRKIKLREDWEEVKVDIMREAVFEKFTQHQDLQQQLLDTGDAVLVEHVTHDRFWGDGGNGRGQNWLGRILMEVREKIRNE